MTGRRRGDRVDGEVIMAQITAWIVCQGERGFKWSGEKPHLGGVITLPDGRQGVVLRIKDTLWFYARRDSENRLWFYPMELWVKPTMKYTPLENLSWKAFVALLNRAHAIHPDREITGACCLPFAICETLQSIPQQEGLTLLRHSVPSLEIDRPWHVPHQCTLRCPVEHLDPCITWRQLFDRFTS